MFFKKEKQNNWLMLVILVFIPLLVGGLSSASVMTDQSVQYSSFVQPDFAPPSWLFGPVWSLLYIMMGVASYLVWRSKDKKKKDALFLYFLQLVFNFCWTLIFFGLRRFDIAFVEIVFLWGLIFANIILFWRIDKRAGWLLIPYILWVSFASMLNFSIWILN